MKKFLVVFFSLFLNNLFGGATVFAQSTSQYTDLANRLSIVESDVERLESRCDGYQTAPARQQCEALAPQAPNDGLVSIATDTANELHELSADFEREIARLNREIARIGADNRELTETLRDRVDFLQTEVNEIYQRLEALEQLKTDFTEYRTATDEQLRLAFETLRTTVSRLDALSAIAQEVSQIRTELDAHVVRLSFGGFGEWGTGRESLATGGGSFSVAWLTDSQAHFGLTTTFAGGDSDPFAKNFQVGPDVGLEFSDHAELEFGFRYGRSSEPGDNGEVSRRPDSSAQWLGVQTTGRWFPLESRIFDLYGSVGYRHDWFNNEWPTLALDEANRLVATGKYETDPLDRFTFGIGARLNFEF